MPDIVEHSDSYENLEHTNELAKILSRQDGRVRARAVRASFDPDAVPCDSCHGAYCDECFSCAQIEEYRKVEREWSKYVAQARAVLETYRKDAQHRAAAARHTGEATTDEPEHLKPVIDAIEAHHVAEAASGHIDSPRGHAIRLARHLDEVGRVWVEDFGVVGLDDIVSEYSHACPRCPKGQEEWVVAVESIPEIVSRAALLPPVALDGGGAQHVDH